jgi:hypothetical protein
MISMISQHAEMGAPPTLCAATDFNVKAGQSYWPRRIRRTAGLSRGGGVWQAVPRCGSAASTLVVAEERTGAAFPVYQRRAANRGDALLVRAPCRNTSAYVPDRRGRVS